MDKTEAALLGVIVGLPLGAFILWLATRVPTVQAQPPSNGGYRLQSRCGPTYYPVYENEETWEWIDYKGRPRKITGHRTVHADVQ